MLMFIDKAFILILLLCTVLIIPFSILLALSICRAIKEIYFDDLYKKSSLLDKFFCIMLIIMIVILEVTLACSLVYLIYRMILVFISGEIIFFNI